MDDSQDLPTATGGTAAPPAAPDALTLSDTALDQADSSPDSEENQPGDASRPAAKKRRRGSRGGKRRKKPATAGTDDSDDTAKLGRMALLDLLQQLECADHPAAGQSYHGEWPDRHSIP